MKIIPVLFSLGIVTPLSQILRPADQIWFNGQTSDDLSERAYIKDVYANMSDSKVEIFVDYYINTRESTFALFNVNGKNVTTSYTDKTSSQKWDQMKIEFKTSEAMTRLRFDFNIRTTRDQLSTNGEFNFDDGTRDIRQISQQGKYKYEFIKSISFSQSSNQFTYQTNPIWFEYNIPKAATFLNVGTPLTIIGDNITYNNVLFYKGEKFNIGNGPLPIGLKNSGIYKLETTINYSFGSSSKTLILYYDYEVLKDYIGECYSSAICIDKNIKVEGVGNDVYKTVT